MSDIFSAEDGVRARLLAYIAPRKPETETQEDALEKAIAAQLDYEANGFGGVAGNVASMSNDGVSVSFAQGTSAPSYTKDSICPVAWSLLRNAGLIAYSLPTAKKP